MTLAECLVLTMNSHIHCFHSSWNEWSFLLFSFYFKKHSISDLLKEMQHSKLRVLLLKHLKLWSVDQQHQHQQGESQNLKFYPRPTESEFTFQTDAQVLLMHGYTSVCEEPWLWSRVEFWLYPCLALWHWTIVLTSLNLYLVIFKTYKIKVSTV